MDFIEIALIGIDGEAAETVSELFNRYGYGGAVVDAYPPHFDKVTVRTVIPHEDDQRLSQIEAMLALIGQALPSGLPQPRLQIVGQSDWAESWKAHFQTIRVGRRFVIKPSWRHAAPQADDIVIEIDPGLAFGSGLHPTTQLCLKILEDLPLQGHSFFDVGTGSGILSIAALKLGATSVRAVDVDDIALRVARENFERNGYALSHPQPIEPLSKSGPGVPRIETAVASADSRGGQLWQVVVANILAHTLIEILPDLAAALAPAGQLILSGIIAEQEADMLAAIERRHLRLIERYVDGDWLAFKVGHSSSLPQPFDSQKL